jgi:hypothetical protein
MRYPCAVVVGKKGEVAAVRIVELATELRRERRCGGHRRERTCASDREAARHPLLRR